jgi:hypothetical protein
MQYTFSGWVVPDPEKDDSIFFLRVKQFTWGQGVQRHYNPSKSHELVAGYSIT